MTLHKTPIIGYSLGSLSEFDVVGVALGVGVVLGVGIGVGVGVGAGAFATSIFSVLPFIIGVFGLLYCFIIFFFCYSVVSTSSTFKINPYLSQKACASSTVHSSPTMSGIPSSPFGIYSLISSPLVNVVPGSTLWPMTC